MEKIEFENFTALESKLTEDKEFAAKILNAVKVTEVGKAYGDTIAKTYFEENKGSAHSYAWDMVDEALQGAGYEKPKGVRTSDWAAQIAKEANTYKQKIEGLRGEGGKEALEKQQAAWIAEKQQLEADYLKSLNDERTKYTELNGKVTISSRRSIIEKELANGTPSAAIDKASFKEISDFKINQLAKNATEENGKIIWNDADGKPYKNGVLNADLDYVVNVVFGNLLQKGKAGGGAQGGTDGVVITGNVLTLDAAKFNTGVEFMNVFNTAASLQGIAKGSEEYYKLYEDTKTAYKVSEMPES